MTERQVAGSFRGLMQQQDKLNYSLISETNLLCYKIDRCNRSKTDYIWLFYCNRRLGVTLLTMSCAATGLLFTLLVCMSSRAWRSFRAVSVALAYLSRFMVSVIFSFIHQTSFTVELSWPHSPTLFSSCRMTLSYYRFLNINIIFLQFF